MAYRIETDNPKVKTILKRMVRKFPNLYLESPYANDPKCVEVVVGDDVQFDYIYSRVNGYADTYVG